MAQQSASRADSADQPTRSTSNHVPTIRRSDSGQVRSRSVGRHDLLSQNAFSELVEKIVSAVNPQSTVELGAAPPSGFEYSKPSESELEALPTGELYVLHANRLNGSAADTVAHLLERGGTPSAKRTNKSSLLLVHGLFMTDSHDGLAAHLEKLVESHSDLKLAVLPAAGGLGVVYSATARWSARVTQLLEPFADSKLLKELETHRVALAEIVAQQDEEIDRRAKSADLQLSQLHRQISGLRAENLGLRETNARLEAAPPVVSVEPSHRRRWWQRSRNGN